VLKLGQRLIYGSAECVAAGRTITYHTVTYARMRAADEGEARLAPTIE
jgi:hypothetical protein